MHEGVRFALVNSYGIQVSKTDFNFCKENQPSLPDFIHCTLGSSTANVVVQFPWGLGCNQGKPPLGGGCHGASRWDHKQGDLTLRHRQRLTQQETPFLSLRHVDVVWRADPAPAPGWFP